MERCPIFLTIIASVSLIFLILSFTVTSHRTILLLLSITLAAMFSLGLTIFCYRRKPGNKGEDLMKFDLGINLKVDTKLTEDKNNCKKGWEKDVDQLPLFSFSSVSTATNNFSSANKLGEGGFGPVYKGVVTQGGEIAVKRLSEKSGQGLKEFKTEASVIAKVQHKNLVRVLGCCIDKDEKILVYEYMLNKSLDFFLFDPKKRELLDWGTRVRIIKGIAQGLLYLHQYFRARIIHRDLKASNILMDKDMNPKISDFGLARIVFGGDEDELKGNTSRIAGTYGYMSPEYALEGTFSVKSDVFSFGVLLLEIVSGKKNTGFYRTDSLNLIGYAWDLWKRNRIIELTDTVLEEASSKHKLLRYVNIALLCVQEKAEDRPTTSHVVSMLTNEAASLLPPKQPAFSYVTIMTSSTSSANGSEDCSVNQVTVSILQAR